MSNIWNKLTELEAYFESRFYATGAINHEPGMDRFNQPGWINKVWKSSTYRRAHIDVVDARETKGLWMMHCCVFPFVDNPAPIFGFDVIAGKNKITGCFLDISPTVWPEHPMVPWFAVETSYLEWHKKRTLPEWAQKIFSPHIVAAGNVQDEAELEQILNIAKRTLDMYLEALPDTANSQLNAIEAQNFYAQQQKQNPHTPKVMASLGLNEDDIKVFIQDCLFPEIA
jgi:phycocyanobilin:ferredoxin oxidoreductase